MQNTPVEVFFSFMGGVGRRIIYLGNTSLYTRAHTFIRHEYIKFIQGESESNNVSRSVGYTRYLLNAISLHDNLFLLFYIAAGSMSPAETTFTDRFAAKRSSRAIRWFTRL